MAGIISNCNRRIFKVLQQISRVPLGRASDGIYIHADGPGAKQAAQAGCAKFEVGIETVADLLLVSFNLFELCGNFWIFHRLFAPQLIKFLVCHGF